MLDVHRAASYNEYEKGATGRRSAPFVSGFRKPAYGWTLKAGFLILPLLQRRKSLRGKLTIENRTVP